MSATKKFNELVDFIVRERESDIWFVGVPDEEPITLSLRGHLDKDTLKWETLGSETASCCKAHPPGDEWREHCRTRDHVETMVKENYDIDRQHDLMKQVIMYDLMVDET